MPPSARQSRASFLPSGHVMRPVPLMKPFCHWPANEKPTFGEWIVPRPSNRPHLNSPS